MTPKINRIYKSALNNKEYLKAIKEADNDNKPTVLSDELIKHLFATAYYGWLVGKYGNNWELYI